jgi:hypothetical protein
MPGAAIHGYDAVAATIARMVKAATLLDVSLSLGLEV